MDIDLRQGLTDAWRQIATFVPKLIGFVIVLIIGWIIAKVLEKVVDKVLERVGFDRAVERGGVGRMLERSKYDASSLIGRLVYYAVLLITLQIGFSIFGPNPVSELLSAIVGWLPKAIVAIIIIVVAAAIARALSDLISGALGATRYGRWLAMAASVFVWALGIIAALNQIGIATTVTTPVLIAVLATIGAILAIGLGGGLVRPMQQRWERWLGRMEEQAPQMRAQAEAYQRGREDAAQRVPTTEPQTEQTGQTGATTTQSRPGDIRET